ncbi:MAG: glycosyltransferase [Planctomycetia bacterium]|nr:glycosyltransferase [Planctomycetia bacterium]
MPPSQPNSAFNRAKSLLRPMLVRGTVAATRLARRLRGRPSPIPADPTLSIVGLFETASGLGVAARGMRRVLADRSPQLVSISDLSRTPRMPDATLDGLTPRPAGAYQTDVAIHAYNPDVFLAAVRRCGTGFLTTARVNMALAIWETDTLPPLWADILSLYDIICTPSQFAARAIQRATNRPVHVVPICLPEKPARRRERSDRHFDFLCMFDHMSDVDRKNPHGAIVAFRDACRRLPPGSSARLRIKCHANTPAAVLDTLRAAAGDAPIEIIAETLDEAGMDALWQQCDCLLSLHRSEDFGLPVAEALSRAIPVIATRQGGILDFVDDAGGFLVSGPAAVAGPRSGPYPEWTGWIEPDLAMATNRIIDVVTDYSQALNRSAVGQEGIRRLLSLQQVQRQFDSALGRRVDPHDTTPQPGR